MQTITVNIRRHSISNKNDLKKDYSISQKGWDLAVNAGWQLEVPEGGIFGYASPKTRAQETERAVLFGAYQSNPARKIDWNGQIQVMPELDTMVSYITRIPDIKAVFDSMPLDDGVNKIINEDPEAFARAGKEVMSFINAICDRYKASDSSVLADGVTHGAKVEAGLIALLKLDIKDIRELGGACKETEGFSVKFVKDGESTLYVPSVVFKGQEYKI